MHKVGPVERTCSRPIFMKRYDGKNVDTMYEISAGKGRGQKDISQQLRKKFNLEENSVPAKLGMNLTR